MQIKKYIILFLFVLFYKTKVVFSNNLFLLPFKPTDKFLQKIYYNGLIYEYLYHDMYSNEDLLKINEIKKYNQLKENIEIIRIEIDILLSNYKNIKIDSVLQNKIFETNQTILKYIYQISEHLSNSEKLKLTQLTIKNNEFPLNNDLNTIKEIKHVLYSILYPDFFIFISYNFKLKIHNFVNIQDLIANIDNNESNNNIYLVYGNNKF